MATWVRSLTGTAPSGTDANVTGTAELDNGTAPGDFDPDGVNSVRFQATLALTSGTIVDDSYNCQFDHNLTLDGNGTSLASVNATNAQINSGASSQSSDNTDSSVTTGLSVAQWEGAEVNPTGGVWATFTQDMKADGTTVAVTVLTVTIDYTPAAAPEKVYPVRFVAPSRSHAMRHRESGSLQ